MRVHSLVAALAFATSLLVAAPAARAELANTPWPMFGHDLRHTGRSLDYSGPSTTKVGAKWKLDTPTHIKTSPAIGPDGTVYIGYGFYPVCAHNPSDGSVKWCSVGGGDAFGSSPAVGVDPDPAPLGPGPVIYMGARDNKLWAVKDLGPGSYSIQWRYKNPYDGDVMGSPAIDPVTDAIYATCGCLSLGLMIAANPTPADMTDGPGELLWSAQADKSIRTQSPAIDDRVFLPGTTTPNPNYRRIYIGSTEGTLYAYTPEGQRIWQIDVGTINRDSSPMIDDNGVIYIGSYAGLAAVRDRGDHPELVWTSLPGGIFDTDGYVSSTATLGRDGTTIYIATSKAKATLHAINAATGTEKWRVTGLYGAVFSQIAVGANGLLYVPAGKVMYAFRDNGPGVAPTMMWQYAAYQPIKWSSPAIGTNQTLYFGSYDGVIHAVVDVP